MAIGRWILAIDFGTTHTAAAIGDRGSAEVVEIDNAPRMSSAVMVSESGELVVGAAAERQMHVAPERVERTPKRRLGDKVILLGPHAVRPVDAVAAVLRRVADEARRRRNGEEPLEIRLTHPARWRAVRLSALREAAALAGLNDPLLIPEPVAAAVRLTNDRADAGDCIAIYDLGGGTFDTAVVCRNADGFEVVGTPGGDERFGGEDLDELVYQALGQRLAAEAPDEWAALRASEGRPWRMANSTLRQEARLAKEGLSSNADYTAYVGAPVDKTIRITREEFEALVRGHVEETLDELETTVRDAERIAQRPNAIVLVGGSSRIPLITRLVADRFGVVPATWGDPKAAVALGAAEATIPGGDELDVVMDDEAGAQTDLDEVAERAPVEQRITVDEARSTRRVRRRVVVGVTALAMAVVAIAIVASQKDRNDGSPPAVSEPFYSESFTNPDSGWSVNDTDDGSFEYVAGEYRISVKSVPHTLRSDTVLEGARFRQDLVAMRDVAVEVDVVPESPTDGNYGVICYQQGTGGDHYYAILGQGGFWGLYKAKGEFISLERGVSGSLEGQQSRRIRLECSGGSDGGPVRLVLFVDNMRIAEAQDAEPLPPGSAGVIVQSQSEPLEVRFDDFALRRIQH